MIKILNELSKWRKEKSYSYVLNCIVFLVSSLVILALFYSKMNLTFLHDNETIAVFEEFKVIYTIPFFIFFIIVGIAATFFSISYIRDIPFDIKSDSLGGIIVTIEDGLRFVYVSAYILLSIYTINLLINHSVIGKKGLLIVSVSVMYILLAFINQRYNKNASMYRRAFKG